MDTINILSIIGIAFLGSFSHCVGMCGGTIIAYSSTKIDDKWEKPKQALAHIVFETDVAGLYLDGGIDVNKAVLDKNYMKTKIKELMTEIENIDRNNIGCINIK